MLQADVTLALVRLSSFDGEVDMRLGKGPQSVVLPHLTYVVRLRKLDLSESCRIWFFLGGGVAPGHEVS